MEGAGIRILRLCGLWRWAVPGALLVFLALAVFAPPAMAAEVLCLSSGSGAGQCSSPEGLATDFDTDHIYVADRGNHRIDVFKADGEFLFAFGWGVDTGEAKLETCTTASSCQQGLPGPGEGQLFSPEFAAVDNVEGSAARHDIYVTDANRRISRFKPDGSFVGAFKGGGGSECHELTGIFLPVAVGPAGNVFVAATEEPEAGNRTGRVEKFTAAGGCLGETVLVTGNPRLQTLAVDGNEDAYVNVSGSGGLELRKYDLGTPETELCSVDPGLPTHVVAMDEAGHLFGAQAEPRDKAPGVFRVITEYDISSCPPTKHVRRFGYEEFNSNAIGLAALHTADGDVFASQLFSNSVKYLKYPPPGPIAPHKSLEVLNVSSANADVRAEINPEGKATTYHFEYVEEDQFEIDEFASGLSTATKELSQAAGTFRVNAAEGLLGCEGGTAKEIEEGKCLKPETVYRWRIVSTNADGAGLGTAEGPAFETKGPLEIEDLWAMEVGTDTATLGAIVNPVGSPTEGHFEYVTDAQFKASGFDEAVKVPAGEAEIDFGEGEAGVKRIVTLYPLQAGTTYHFRIAATNDVLKASSSEDFVSSAPETFRTFDPRGPSEPCSANDAFRIGAAALLPDCRAYELVSPLDKENGDIKAQQEFTSTLPAVVNQSSLSGERLTYGSYRAFADTRSAPYTSQYIAARDPEAGWLSDVINPPQDGSIKGSVVLDNEYRFFSDDLCEGWITPFFEPTLAEGAIPGYYNLYRRTELCEEETETYEAITTAAPLNLGLPQNEDFLYKVEPQGHAADGSVTAFVSNDSLGGTGAPSQPGGPGGCKKFEVEPGKFSGGNCKKRLYVKGEGLGAKPRFVCIRPGGVTISANENCAAGTFNNVGRFGSARSPNVKGAFSEDGKRLFWSTWTEDVNPDGKIYLRENPLGSGGECSNESAPCTREVSKAGELASGSSGAHFWQAALDGSAALYTTGGDLYRYVTASKTSELVAGEVLGLVGASEDVQRVYFASKEALTGGEENEVGQKAKVGEPNLYLHEAGEGGGIRFIGQLAASDLGAPGFLPTSPIVPEPVSHNGRVSESGLHAAFMSAAPMTGYDNTDTKSGKADTEVFVYDASADEGAGELLCASCSPTNGRPSGRQVEEGVDFWIAGRIPASYSTLAEPEVLAPDGRRLIFESADALVPRDTNGRLDVYEWERAGQGSCTEEDATFSESAGGCIDLISTGQSLADSEIVDVSQTAVGADVFFNTLEGLLPQDYGLRDIYNARIGGGFEPPPPPTLECEGESCQSPAAAPEFQIGASETNVDPGNMTQKKSKGCPKGKHKVKRGGKSRCVPNKKKGKGSKAKQRRTAR